MAKHRQRVMTGIQNGVPLYTWVQGDNLNELNDHIVRAYIMSGRIWEFMDTSAVYSTTKGSKTFSQYANDWMEIFKLSALKHTTLSMYRSMLTVHLIPVFGDKPLSEISTQDIQTFLNQRKDMSRKTLVSLKNLMSEILNDAMEDGLIDVNPAQSKRIVIPSTKVNVRKALPIDVFKTILSSLPQLIADDRRLMALMMLTGMRRGEILGLRWEDIRFTDNLILVQRNVTYSNNQPHVGTPKTTNGERIVPLNALLLEFLKPYHEHGYILGNEKPFTEAAYRRSMERIDKHIDLHGATAHIFRHSYLTYIAGTGIDIKTLQAIAGHADVKLTMNRYVHKQTSNIVAAGERIQTLLTT